MKKYIVHYTEYDGERENLTYSAISLDAKHDFVCHLPDLEDQKMILAKAIGLDDDDSLVVCPITDRYEIDEGDYYQYTLDDIRPITEEHLRIINKYIYI